MIGRSGAGTEVAMNRWQAWITTLAMAGALAACQQGGQAESMLQSASGAAMAPATADRAMPAPETAEAADDVGAMLAYEHSAGIAIDADAIPERLQSVREACTSRKFGACVVLNVQQSGGDHPSAMLAMRIAPAGVEPMIALASNGARLGSRSTHAEDLAVVVRDNQQMQERLRKELARLQEFQQRRDLAVADMIALSQRMAEAEAQLQAAEQEGAQHQRRIDTQLLTLHFTPPGGQEGRNEVVQAVRDFGRLLSMGTAWTIRAAAFLIPLLLALGLLVFVLRRLRRRRG